MNISLIPRFPVMNESRCMNVSTAMTRKEKIIRAMRKTVSMLFIE